MKTQAKFKTPNDFVASPEPRGSDGYQQVVEMLKVAEPHFVDSLLDRLAKTDKSLADSIRRDVLNCGLSGCEVCGNE